MSKDDSKKSKSSNEQTTKKHLTKPTGRSLSCSIFIYTFVFVSGVVVATLLPDLAGHHFKQPYGKEYGVMAEKVFKDLPKHLKSFSETAMIVGRDILDRALVLKAEVERRIGEMTNKKEDKTNERFTTKQTSRTTARTTSNKVKDDHAHTARAHDTVQSTKTTNDRSSQSKDL